MEAIQRKKNYQAKELEIRKLILKLKTRNVKKLSIDLKTDNRK